MILKVCARGPRIWQKLIDGRSGYTLLLWNNILQWPKDEYQVFLMQMRKELRSKSIHSYMTLRYVWGRKPE